MPSMGSTHTVKSDHVAARVAAGKVAHHPADTAVRSAVAVAVAWIDSRRIWEVVVGSSVGAKPRVAAAENGVTCMGGYTARHG